MSTVLEHGVHPDAAAGDPPFGGNALQTAVKMGHESIVELLLDKRAAINKRSMSDRTPIWAAALGGRFSIAMLLADRGADLNLQDNKFSYSPAAAAACNGFAAIVELLHE